jgi:WD40 repeat protein
LVLSSLRGDIRALEANSDMLNIDAQQAVVRFFVSSTFDDTKHERDVLIKCVMPALQRYARSFGFETILSEMRFGIRKSLGDDHKTTEVCMAELQRCIETSAGLSYMLLSCNRYGFRAPPRRIPACDMAGMLACMPVDERAIVLEYYALDENELRTPQECYNISVNLHGAFDIPGPAYILRSVSSVPSFWSRFPLLQSALRNAADLFWPNASSTHLRDPQSQHPVKFFYFSITEEEISRGVFWRDSSRLPKTVHVFQRTLRASGGADLQQMPIDAPELKNYIDLSSDKTAADLVAARLLREQQNMIALSLSQAPACLTTFQSIEWQAGKGISPSNAQHAAYLQQFAEKALACLLNSIDEARQRLAVESHADMAEAIFHLKFAAHRARQFALSPETRRVATSIRNYVHSTIGPGHAFFVFGASGSGKTYLMAEAADGEARALKTPADAVIVRFLGTTPASSNAIGLLSSLCRQLHAISANGPVPSSFDDIEKLKDYFEIALKTWRAGRLTVFLDSLDQLDDTSGGRMLRWLPTHGLSPNVRLIVSTLPDEAAPVDGKPFACLSILQKRFNSSPPDFVMAEVLPVHDVRSLLLHLLKVHQHKLSDDQLRVLEVAVKFSPKMQTPLVLAILAVRFSEWPSYRDLPPDNKNPDGSLFIDTSSVRALIGQEFKTLEEKHGIELVRAVLSFITLAKDGVSETELSEMLSLDDDVLASVYEWWVPPVRTLPTNPLTMLLADLKPYLTFRGAWSGGGGLMMRWYHRQFWEAANEYLFCDAEERRRRHAQLSEFFLGLWADRSKPYNDNLKIAVQKKVVDEVSGDRRVRPQPLCLKKGKNIFVTRGDTSAVNERRCRESAHHLLAADMLCDAADELCNFEGICARVRCGEGFTLLQQLKYLCSHIKEEIPKRNPQAVRAIHQLRRLEHYVRWLQMDMNAIVKDPEVEIITSCSRQPEVSLARKEMKVFLQSTSDGISFDCNPFFRSFVLGPLEQNFSSCISELKHHQGPVQCVAYNFDCSLLASASYDNTVAVWNAEIGVIEFNLKGHTGIVHSLAWATGGQQIVTGSDDCTVRLWDIGTQQAVVLSGHADRVTSVAFDCSDKYLASSSDDNTVRIWDATTQQVVAVITSRAGRFFTAVLGESDRCLTSRSDEAELLWDVSTQQHDAEITGLSRFLAVAFDKNGEYLAAGSDTVLLWHVGSKQEVAVLSGHAGCISALAFDRSGKYLASGSVDCTVRLWDIGTQQVVAVLTGHTTYVYSVAFDGSGKLLASSSGSSTGDNTVRLWDVSTQQEVAVLSGHTDIVKSVAFDDSRKYLASGSFDRTVRVWDLNAQQEVVVITGHTDRVCSVAFDDSGKHLASASFDGTVRLWDVSTCEEFAFLGHSDRVVSVAFDKFNNFLASGSWDNSVRLWDFSTQQEVAVLLGHTERVHSVSFDRSGKYLASGSDDCTVRLWDIGTQQAVAVLTGHTTYVYSVAFGSGKLLASGSGDNTVRLWDVSTQQEVAVLSGHNIQDDDDYNDLSEFLHDDRSVLSVAFDASGEYLASGSGDCTVRLWDISTRLEVAVLLGHTGPVSSVSFDRSSKYLASASHDNTVRVWDVGTRQELAVLAGDTNPRLYSFSEGFCSVAFNGSYLASGSDNHTLRLWDVSTPHEMTAPLFQTNRGFAFAFDGSGMYLALSSSDHSLILWNVHTHAIITCLTGHTSPITSVLFSPSSNLIAAASSDACIRLWMSPSGASVAVLTGRPHAAVRCMAWSRDEALLAVGACDGSVCVWHAASGLPRVVLQCPLTAHITRVTLSPDTRFLAAAVGTTATCVYVFDVASFSLLASPALRGEGEHLQWSADGRVLHDDKDDLWHAP